MAKGIDELTDRERDVLRLLLAGHTAKSAARDLDLSVHTVNDYLRDARKKLGVTSSREAARILGEQVEAPPQNIAPEQIGIALPGAHAHNASIDNMQTGGSRRVVWIIGGTVMIALAIALALAATSSGTASHPTPEAPAVAQAQDKAASDAALAWVAHVDKGDWNASWEAAGTAFRGAVTAKTWAAQVEPVRAPLGTVMTRSLKGVTAYDKLPGAPAGEYRIVEFDTKFSDAPTDAVETAVMVREGTGWSVVGYFIKPADPLGK